ncbi:MAG TPA: hypothetical protein VHG08_09945 [Longimicrobium sp.]|nr:hypothetical protein [Longimicrobium sp.]
MYRSCIYCSARLGANDAIERFPVGRSLAFDEAKGRLWAVCPRCARWNLAPIHERWEAIEDAERLFRDARVRVQGENIGLVKVADGTRLIRIGKAPPGELAAWRYGRTLFRRYARQMWAGGALTAGSVVAAMGSGLALGTVYPGVGVMMGVAVGWGWVRGRRVLQMVRTPSASQGGELLAIRREDLADAQLVQPQEGDLGIHFPQLRWTERGRFAGREFVRKRSAPLTVTGDPARALLARAMVHVSGGGDRYHVNAALERIEAAGSPEAYLQDAAKAGRRLVRHDDAFNQAMGSLALEMALHEETERRALQGELAMLEAMWREAEEIAAIADRLPDLPAPEPPRLGAAD